MNFLGERVRFGGLFPIRIIRLFRHGRGRCENRWMDEHILVEGATAQFAGEIIDDNRNSLTWWTEKHNAYASREVVVVTKSTVPVGTAEKVAEAIRPSIRHPSGQVPLSIPLVKDHS